MTSAVGTIAEQVRQRVRREGVDLHGDRELAEGYVRDEVQRYAEVALGGSVPLLDDESHVTRQVVAAITGLGPLQPYREDPAVEEVWINAPDDVLLGSTIEETEPRRKGGGLFGRVVVCNGPSGEPIERLSARRIRPAA